MVPTPNPTARSAVGLALAQVRQDHQRLPARGQPPPPSPQLAAAGTQRRRDERESASQHPPDDTTPHAQAGRQPDRPDSASRCPPRRHRRQRGTSTSSIQPESASPLFPDPRTSPSHSNLTAPTTRTRADVRTCLKHWLYRRGTPTGYAAEGPLGPMRARLHLTTGLATLDRIAGKS